MTRYNPADRQLKKQSPEAHRASVEASIAESRARLEAAKASGDSVEIEIADAMLETDLERLAKIDAPAPRPAAQTKSLRGITTNF